MIISKRLSKKQSKQYIASIGEAVIINLLSSAVIEILTLKNITRGNLPDVIRNLINVYRGSNSYDAIGKYIQDHLREIDETIMSTLNIVKIDDEYLEKDPYYSSVKIDFAILNNQNQPVGFIEYNGKQHYDINDAWYKPEVEEGLVIKEQYAQENNIPFIIISYQDDIISTLENFIMASFLLYDSISYGQE